MASLFISYANEDRQFADALKRALGLLDHTPWWFGDGVPGEKLEEAIFNRIRTVDALIVIVSTASVASNWVNRELGAALAYADEKGRPILIPVLLDDVSLAAPLSKYFGIRANRDNSDEVALQISIALDRLEGANKARNEMRVEIQKKVEISAADFIQKSLQELNAREVSYRRLAYSCYGTAFVTLAATVGFGLWRTLWLHPNLNDWLSLAEVAVSGIIVIGLLVALSKYTFLLGKSFMVEALRNADRRHAISFGEFFLRAYGANAEWKDVKDAFQNWNIDKGSNFMGQSGTDFDPQIFSLAIEVAKSIAGKVDERSKHK